MRKFSKGRPGTMRQYAAAVSERLDHGPEAGSCAKYQIREDFRTFHVGLGDLPVGALHIDAVQGVRNFGMFHYFFTDACHDQFSFQSGLLHRINLITFVSNLY